MMVGFSSVMRAIANGARLVLGFAPVMSALIPQSAGNDTIQEVAQVVATVERTAEVLGGADGKGEQKLAAAVPLVSHIIDSRLVLGRKIADTTGFEDGVKLIVSGVVKILNSIEHKS